MVRWCQNLFASNKLRGRDQNMSTKSNGGASSVTTGIRSARKYLCLVTHLSHEIAKHPGISIGRKCILRSSWRPMYLTAIWFLRYSVLQRTTQ
jgi:hypothetical protein